MKSLLEKKLRRCLSLLLAAGLFYIAAGGVNAVGTDRSAPPDAETDKLEVMVPLGHFDIVNCVAVSKDGKYLLSGSADRRVRLWETQTGRMIRIVAGHSRDVNSVAFSPDGRLVGSWCGSSSNAGDSRDYALHLWDLQTGKAVTTLENATKEITAFAFSPDGRTIACGGASTVAVYEIASGKMLWSSAEGLKGNVDALAFTSDGSTLATGCYNLTDNSGAAIKMWDAATGAVKQILPGEHKVDSLAFSPDGKTLASGEHVATLLLWDLATGQPRKLTGHTSAVISSVAFSPDGSRLLSASWDNTARLWDVRTGQEIRQFPFPPYTTNAAFSADGKSVLLPTADADGAVLFPASMQMLEADTGNLIRRYTGYALDIRFATMSRDGETVWNLLDDGSLRQWQLATGREKRRIAAAPISRTAALSSDGKLLLTGADRGIALWDAATGARIRDFTLPDTRFFSVTTLAFSPDGKYALSGSRLSNVGSGGIWVWDVQTGRTVNYLANISFTRGDKAGVQTHLEYAALSPDNRYLLCRMGDSSLLRMWDMRKSLEVDKYVQEFRHKDRVRSFAFSPDGKNMVSGSQDETIRIWEVETGRELRQITDNLGWVYSVAYSPDGRMIVSSSSDDTIRLWDAATGRELRRFQGRTYQAREVKFSPNGKYVLSIGYNYVQRVWDVASGRELFSYASLTDGDWLAYNPDMRFDGSPGGIEKVYFTRGLQTYPLTQFLDKFYTPRLIGRVMSGALLAPPRVEVTTRFKAPPRVRILSPKPGETLSGDTVQVQVEAIDQGGGVEDVRLFHNGKRIEGDAKKVSEAADIDGRIACTYNVSLLAGANTLRVTAFNSDRTEAIPAEVTVQCTINQPTANLYILAIGISYYQNPKYLLEYPREDARAFTDVVAQKGKGLFKQIVPILVLDKEATRTGIGKAFTRLTAQARPQDAFIFYYSGHGAMSDSQAGLEPEFHLVCSDVLQLHGDMGLVARGVSAGQLKTWCRAVQARKQMLVLDACESGGVVNAFVQRGVEEEDALDQLARSEGMVVLAAALTVQPASEYQALRHGVFTYALLKGLQGEAGIPDGRVTPAKLKSYIEKVVPDLVKKYRGQAQYPTGAAYGQDFPIGITR
jgi:WD40 repeat protein